MLPEPSNDTPPIVRAVAKAVAVAALPDVSFVIAVTAQVEEPEPFATKIAFAAAVKAGEAPMPSLVSNAITAP